MLIGTFQMPVEELSYICFSSKIVLTSMEGKYNQIITTLTSGS